MEASTHYLSGGNLEWIRSNASASLGTPDQELGIVTSSSLRKDSRIRGTATARV